jgi:hypothetical protein
MSKTSYVDILPELEAAYWKNLQPGDRLVVPRVRKKIAFLSRARKKGVTIRSLLPEIAEIWNGFSELEKEAWVDAAAEMSWKGYNLFVQDQSLRIKNDYPGTATPSLLHQSYVGVLQIEEPADELKIIQIHPHFYWTSKKIKGTKNQYQPVLVTEDLALPLKISLNYRAELEAVAEEHFAKFYARVWHSFQGSDLFTDLEISFDYLTDWKSAEATLTSLAGYVVRYDLYIHLKGLQGTLYIDNVKAEHSGQNWVRDSFCRDINQGFTRAFYQIPKHWSAVTAPDGAWFESFYIDW